MTCLLQYFKESYKLCSFDPCRWPNVPCQPYTVSVFVLLNEICPRGHCSNLLLDISLRLTLSFIHFKQSTTVRWAVTSFGTRIKITCPTWIHVVKPHLDHRSGLLLATTTKLSRLLWYYIPSCMKISATRIK